MSRPSSGCSATRVTGTLTTKTMLWSEPGLPPVNRTVQIYAPSAVGPLPMVLVFHGWGEEAIKYHEQYTFGLMAEAAGFIAVYPQGLGEDNIPSWNAGGTTVEEIDGPTKVCDEQKVVELWGKGANCYESCRRDGACHACSWTTCYNDLDFVRQLLDELGREYCIDLSRIFAWGCSNGGIMVHSLARRLPGRFRAVASACGGKPHQGYERNFTPGPPVPILLVQGSDDQTIPRTVPPPKTPWWDGYVYATETEVLDAYYAHNGCTNPAPRPWPLPPQVDSQEVSCSEIGYDCSEGSKVVSCGFTGGHDLITGTGGNDILDGPELAWYFFCQLSPSGDDSGCRLPQVQAEATARASGLTPKICMLAIPFVLLNLYLTPWRRARRDCRARELPP